MDERDVCKHFANNLKHYMELEGMSQRQLADAIGIAHSAVNAWVNGKYIPRTPVLRKMTELFGCELSQLLLPKVEDAEEPNGLTADELELIKLYRSAPASKREAFLNLLR